MDMARGVFRYGRSSGEMMQVTHIKRSLSFKRMGMWNGRMMCHVSIHLVKHHFKFMFVWVSFGGFDGLLLFTHSSFPLVHGFTGARKLQSLPACIFPKWVRVRAKIMNLNKQAKTRKTGREQSRPVFSIQ
ncbi:hypothetical protein HMPREF9374_1423 [Desmospora sp. 8437]|nr:hypothetical protein HMPREF9374_1423 [Desmospora sp. 8437]